MPSTVSHPRRRPASPSATCSLLESFAGLSLKKGTTFHSPTSNKSDLFNPLESAANPCSMPPRSTTSPKDLEDLLIGAGERRAADLLARVDQVISNNQSAAALGKLLSQPEALPNPRCVLENTSLDDIPEERRESNHAYDSGLGSSIADSDEFDLEKAETSSKDCVKQSPSRLSAPTGESLSDFALDQIHKHIIKPILDEEELKDFHPLIKGVPRRIGDREITNLRDLEKTLIFLAPDYSRSPSAYLDFCETYIDCLHATVDSVHESDHCSPSDRPYTNNYFFDLVAQIRRYAQIVAATRSKQEKGEELDEMDVSPHERLRLWGGVSHTDTPAQLVRHKDGKNISIATGEVLSTSPSDHSALSSKRPMSTEDPLDDGASRSMARRRKGEPIKTYECGFQDCDKTFRRPCDRTKHMKSHERPWKCPHIDCKYHEDGWPTEKECERHVNDKHAEAPTMYGCYWRNVNNCPYQSKRLSNCKSHMEKAHGWNYIRSKTTKNGKTKVKPGAKEPVQQPIRLTGGVAMGPPASTPASSSASDTPFLQPAAIPVSHSSSSSSRQGSSVPSIAQPTFTPFESPALPTMMDFAPEFTDHFNFDFNNFGSVGFGSVQYPYTPSLCDDRRPSHGSSVTGTAPNSVLIQGETSFDEAIGIPPTPEDTPFNALLDGFKFPQDQINTYQSPNNFNTTNGFVAESSAINDVFSPHAHPMNGGDLTFTAPQPLADEGFGGDVSMGNDFDMSNYLPGNYTNDSLFPDTTGFGLGAQFEEPAEKNPYAQYFPELN